MGVGTARTSYATALIEMDGWMDGYSDERMDGWIE